jgi:integrase|tara:strand:- start:2056 stop:2619 length:564 start_codon:yes stop_codon:yes gene_type:complete
MTVEPIRDKKDIERLYIKLKKQNLRNALLFRMGCNTILRIGDLLRIQYQDIFSANGDYRHYLLVKEAKNGKMKKVPLNSKIRSLITEYVQHYELDSDDWLFFSYRNPSNPLDRVTAWKQMKQAANDIGIEGFGTHTMRKTLAYHVYKKTKNLALVMTMLNHSRPSITMRYLGIVQDEIDAAYSSFEL